MFQWSCGQESLYRYLRSCPVLQQCKHSTYAICPESTAHSGVRVPAERESIQTLMKKKGLTAATTTIRFWSTTKSVQHPRGYLQHCLLAPQIKLCGYHLFSACKELLLDHLLAAVLPGLGTLTPTSTLTLTPALTPILTLTPTPTLGDDEALGDVLTRLSVIFTCKLTTISLFLFRRQPRSLLWLLQL